jgi:tetratricopeptide (TPR) repeat protein
VFARLVSVFAAAVVCLAPAFEAGAASRWTRLRTPNFVLLGTHGDRPLRRVAERLEQFREVFARVFPNTRQAMPAPIVVHVFGNERAYRPFMPRFNGKVVDVAGYFQQTAGAYYITLNTQAGERAYSTIYHEYVHLLVGNTLAEVPVWFSEGLAEFYETYEMYGEREATLGKVNEGHVYTLRERFIPLPELLAVDHTSPMYNEGDRRGIFYAESWALVHYLMLGNPARHGQLATYLQLHADGKPPAEAVRTAFGVETGALEKELRSYVNQSLYRSNRVKFADKVAIDKDWVVDQPSDADGEAACADLLLASRRLDEAAARAEAVLQKAPGHARAQAVLGRVRALQGEADAAAALLDAAVKAGGDDYLPPYYQAASLLRREGPKAGPITEDAARQALALLQRVVAAQPSLADAHGLIAFGSLVADEPKAAMAAAAKAFSLSPRHEYALFHARARVHQQDPGVRAALTALAARGSADWIRHEAQALLNHLTRIEQLRASPAHGAVAAAAPAAPPTAAGVTGGATAAESAPPASTAPRKLIPVFRKMGAGEIRDIGRFEGTECTRDGIVFKVRTSDRLARVSAKTFAQVEFFTYRPEPPGQVGCGALSAPPRVYLTWRLDGGIPGTDGAAVAIELLADDFRP